MLIALVAEYQKASDELIGVLGEIDEVQFTVIRDEKTPDPDCRSILSVMAHVVSSGYTYINYINGKSGIPWNDPDLSIGSADESIKALNEMLDYTESSLGKILHLSDDELEDWSFETRWGVTYDIEQLLEHAIVHVLRHRRQIEQFLIK